MIPLELLKQKETNKNSRKTFVENLRLCSEQAELHKREKRTLCQQCSGVFSNSYEERWQLDIGTLQELSYSSEKGCILCDLLKEAISSISSTGPSDKYRLSVDWDKSRLTIERCLNGYSRSRSLEEIPFFGGFVEKDIPVHAELDMFVDKDDAASSVIYGRPDVEDFISSGALHIIQHWLHECRTSKYHDTCKSNVDQETPLRLIDVGKEGDRHVTLSQDHGVVDYVALSYCWGGPQDVVLTAEDVEQAVFAFEYWTLPATIQDAITITRKLGISYLWIDALCIIQRGDDGKDFAFQGPKMDSIYGSAYITIAAAGTSSVNDGFLNSHKIQGSKYYVATVPYELVSKERGTIMFSTRNRKREYEAEPLLSRCWTLQERILSPRVLSFHSDHLTWNCRNSHHSSDGLFWPVTDLDYLLPSIIPFEFFMHVDKPTTKIPEFWRLCVEDYSNRFRSVETDKLVALAGVARRIHKQTGDVYLAGLWKSDIMKQLCWSTDNECNQSFVRPSRYLAPSWSWVSLDSKINVAKFIDNDFYWRAHLVDVKTILFDESSPFAEVTDGWLVLRGQVKQARTMDKHGNWVPMSFSNDNARRAAESNATTSIRSYLSSIMDGGCAVDTRQFCELYWLWLFSDQSKTFLLLLEPTPQETIFIRVGWIELKVGEVDFEWFDDAETQDITIL